MEAIIRERMFELRRRGCSFGEVATRLGLSRETVKSACRRAGIQPETYRGSECAQCGQLIEHGRSGQRFCSTECRLNWWHQHPERLDRRAIYEYTCAGCEEHFVAYGNAKRKYCSHGCYIHHRFVKRGTES